MFNLVFCFFLLLIDLTFGTFYYVTFRERWTIMKMAGDWKTTTPVNNDPSSKISEFGIGPHNQVYAVNYYLPSYSSRGKPAKWYVRNISNHNFADYIYTWNTTAFSEQEVVRAACDFDFKENAFFNLEYDGASKTYIVKVDLKTRKVSKISMHCPSLRLFVDTVNRQFYYVCTNSRKQIASIRRLNYDGASDELVFDVTTESGTDYYSVGDIAVFPSTKSVLYLLYTKRTGHILHHYTPGGGTEQISFCNNRGIPYGMVLDETKDGIYVYAHADTRVSPYNCLAHVFPNGTDDYWEVVSGPFPIVAAHFLPN